MNGGAPAVQPLNRNTPAMCTKCGTMTGNRILVCGIKHKIGCAVCGMFKGLVTHARYYRPADRKKSGGAK